MARDTSSHIDFASRYDYVIVQDGSRLHTDKGTGGTCRYRGLKSANEGGFCALAQYMCVQIRQLEKIDYE